MDNEAARMAWEFADAADAHDPGNGVELWEYEGRWTCMLVWTGRNTSAPVMVGHGPDAAAALEECSTMWRAARRLRPEYYEYPQEGY